MANMNTPIGRDQPQTPLHQHPETQESPNTGKKPEVKDKGKVDEEENQGAQVVEEKQFVKEKVSIGGKSYTVTVRYNEKALGEKYGVEGDQLQETVRKIIVNLKPEDLLTLVGQQVSSAHFQGKQSFVQFKGQKQVPLSQLKTENPPLAHAIKSIRNSFDASQVKQLIANSKSPNQSVFSRPPPRLLSRSSSYSTSRDSESSEELMPKLPTQDSKKPTIRPLQQPLKFNPSKVKVDFSSTSSSGDRVSHFEDSDPSQSSEDLPTKKSSLVILPKLPQNISQETSSTETQDSKSRESHASSSETDTTEEPLNLKSLNSPPKTSPKDEGDEGTISSEHSTDTDIQSEQTKPQQIVSKGLSGTDFQDLGFERSEEPPPLLPTDTNLPPSYTPPSFDDVIITMVSTGDKSEQSAEIKGTEKRPKEMITSSHPMDEPEVSKSKMSKGYNLVAKRYELDINKSLNQANSQNPSVIRNNLSDAYESLLELGKLRLEAPGNTDISETFTKLEERVGSAFKQHSNMSPEEKGLVNSLISATNTEATVGNTNDFSTALKGKLKQAISQSKLGKEEQTKLENLVDQPKDLTRTSLEQLLKVAKSLPSESKEQFKTEIGLKESKLKENEAKQKEGRKTMHHLKPDDATAIYTKLLYDQLASGKPTFPIETLRIVVENAEAQNPKAKAAIIKDEATNRLLPQIQANHQLAEANAKAVASIKNSVKFKKVHEDYEKQIQEGKIRTDVSLAKDGFDKTLIEKNIETRQKHLEQYHNAEKDVLKNFQTLTNIAKFGSGSPNGIELSQLRSKLEEITTDGVHGPQIAEEFVESLKTVDEFNANVSSNFGTAFGAGAPPYISDVDTGPIANTLLALEGKDKSNTVLYQQLNGLVDSIKIAMDPGKSLKPLYEEDTSGNRVPRENIPRTPEITQTIETMKQEMTRLMKDAEQLNFPPRNPNDPLRPSDVGNTTKEFFISTCLGTIKKLDALDKNLQGDKPLQTTDTTQDLLPKGQIDSLPPLDVPISISEHYKNLIEKDLQAALSAPSPLDASDHLLEAFKNVIELDKTAPDDSVWQNVDQAFEKITRLSEKEKDLASAILNPTDTHRQYTASNLSTEDGKQLFIKILLDQYTPSPKYGKEEILEMVKNVKRLRPSSGILNDEKVATLLNTLNIMTQSSSPKGTTDSLDNLSTLDIPKEPPPENEMQKHLREALSATSPLAASEHLLNAYTTLLELEKNAPQESLRTSVNQAFESITRLSDEENELASACLNPKGNEEIISNLKPENGTQLLIKILLNQYTAQPQYEKGQIQQMINNINGLRPISGITKGTEVESLINHLLPPKDLPPDFPF